MGFEQKLHLNRNFETADDVHQRKHLMLHIKTPTESRC